MTATPEMLEQFVRESRVRAERLSDLLLDAAGPASATAKQLASELRDAAAGAELPSLSELAGAVERVCVAVADGALHWEPSLGGALMAGVDELTTLVGNAARWSGDDDARARASAADLSAYAPAPSFKGTGDLKPGFKGTGDLKTGFKGTGDLKDPGDDPRPIVPIESLFYTEQKSPIEMAASLLDTSISAMGALSEALTGLVGGMSTGASKSAGDKDVVPVEDLVYRGRAALDRAIEVRDELREAGGPPDPAALDELYDLIALARVG